MVNPTVTAPPIKGSKSVAWLSASAARTKQLHCLIHQSLLGTRLSGGLKNTMDSVMSIFIVEEEMTEWMRFSLTDVCMSVWNRWNT